MAGSNALAGQNRNALLDTLSDTYDAAARWIGSNRDSARNSFDQTGITLGGVPVTSAAIDKAMAAAGFAPMGMAGTIKAAGNFSPKLIYPDEFNGMVQNGLNVLPKSAAYDAAGMFPVDAAAIGKLRQLTDGNYLGTLEPQWLSKTKPFYAVGDNLKELIDKIRSVATNSDKAISAARTAKIPKDVRAALESQFGNNFSYDISNSANSGSYYITHNPSGTKIRVSDHDLPGYYENTAHLDIRPDEVSLLPSLLSEFLKGGK